MTIDVTKKPVDVTTAINEMEKNEANVIFEEVIADSIRYGVANISYRTFVEDGAYFLRKRLFSGKYSWRTFDIVREEYGKLIIKYVLEQENDIPF